METKKLPREYLSQGIVLHGILYKPVKVMEDPEPGKVCDFCDYKRICLSGREEITYCSAFEWGTALQEIGEIKEITIGAEALPKETTE